MSVMYVVFIERIYRPENRTEFLYLWPDDPEWFHRYAFESDDDVMNRKMEAYCSTQYKGVIWNR